MRLNPASERGRSPSTKPISRSGNTSSVNRYTKLVMSPSVAAPARTRYAPTKSSNTFASPGTTSRNASNVARMVATFVLAIRKTSPCRLSRSTS
jgi:hypothetical protein